MIFHGDCLQIMQDLKDNSANAVITSPPYNMNLRVRDGKYCSRQIVKEISTKYVDYEDNMTMDDYFFFNKLVIKECLRIAPIVFYNVQFITGNKRALFRLMGEMSNFLKEVIIWDKVVAEPAIGSGVLNSQFEVVFVFERDEESAMLRQFKNHKFKRGSLSNVWKIQREAKYDNSHGATFPTALVNTILENFTDVGDVILDPFMGTGTTGVCCHAKGREFIGIEISKPYYDMAKERLELASRQSSLFV